MIKIVKNELIMNASNILVFFIVLLDLLASRNNKEIINHKDGNKCVKVGLISWFETGPEMIKTSRSKGGSKPLHIQATASNRNERSYCWLNRQNNRVKTNKEKIGETYSCGCKLVMLLWDSLKAQRERNAPPTNMTVATTMFRGELAAFLNVAEFTDTQNRVKFNYHLNSH